MPIGGKNDVDGDTSGNATWHRFRGPSQNGRTTCRLPHDFGNLRASPAWVATLPGGAVGGVSVADGKVFVGTRDGTDQADLFLAFDARTGRPIWSATYPAPLKLDYGNTPRATPVYDDGVLVTLGAGGTLSGLDAATGVPLWRVSLISRFGVDLPTWGFCGTPVVAADRVITPLSDRTPIAAVDLFSGATVWTADDGAAAYASPIIDPHNGESVYLVDAAGPVARRISDGGVRWRYTLPIKGDFGVPTAVPVGDRIFFIGENNGLIVCDAASRATNADLWRVVDDTLLPDSHTPTPVGDDVVVAFEGVHRVAADGRRLWSAAEDAVNGYAATISDASVVWVWTEDALMLSIDAATGRELDRWVGDPRRVRTLSHPAIAAGWLYIVIDQELRAYQLPE